MTYTAKQNKVEKVGRGGQEEKKKIPSSKVVNEEIPQEGQQPGSFRQCNNLTESSNDEGSDEDDGTTCTNLQDPLDRTGGEMGKSAPLL